MFSLASYVTTCEPFPNKHLTYLFRGSSSFNHDPVGVYLLASPDRSCLLILTGWQSACCLNQITEFLVQGEVMTVFKPFSITDVFVSSAHRYQRS